MLYATKGMLLTQDAAYTKGDERNTFLMEAQSAFQTAFSLSERQSDSYHWYANLLLMMNHPEEAIQNYQKAIELNPLAPILHRALAEIYALSAKPAKAHQSFEQAKSLQPLSIDKYYLQHFYQRLRPQHIVDFFSQTETANCETSHDCQTMALMLYSLNAIEAGRDWQLKTMEPRYLSRVAKLWMEVQYLAAKNDLSGVAALLKERVTLSDTPLYHQQLVSALLASGKTDEARRSLATLVPELEKQGSKPGQF